MADGDVSLAFTITANLLPVTLVTAGSATGSPSGSGASGTTADADPATGRGQAAGTGPGIARGAG